MFLRLSFMFALLAGAVGAETPFESAFRQSALRSFDEASTKILKLAEAIPEETYAWRPMEGVASVREVLVHVTSTNYGLGARLGGKSTVDRRTLGERMQTKAEAIAVARESMDYIREVLRSVPAEELIVEVNVFGKPAPKLRVAFLPVDHAHEHLGQLIAYARMNKIVPPWSR